MELKLKNEFRGMFVSSSKNTIRHSKQFLNPHFKIGTSAVGWTISVSSHSIINLHAVPNRSVHHCIFDISYFLCSTSSSESINRSNTLKNKLKIICVIIFQVTENCITPDQTSRVSKQGFITQDVKSFTVHLRISHGRGNVFFHPLEVFLHILFTTIPILLYVPQLHTL